MGSMNKFLSGLRGKAWRIKHRLQWAADLPTLVNLYRDRPGVHPIRVRVANQTATVHVRGKTLDRLIAELIVNDDSEYKLPDGIAPKVIFDIGANIGCTAVYFAHRYPEAKIYCFEPLPENLKLLRKNVAPFGDRITIINKGLGTEEGHFDYCPSDDPANFGGGTFQQVGCDTTHTIRLPVTTLSRVCRELNLDHVDVIKIDTEGAEMSILRGAPRELVQSSQIVIGELHGVEDEQVVEYLKPTHQLKLHRENNAANYPFLATRRAA